MPTSKSKPMKLQLTPWQRLARAAQRGTGVRLSADEVARLSWDDALMKRARLDDDECPLCDETWEYCVCGGNDANE